MKEKKQEIFNNKNKTTSNKCPTNIFLKGMFHMWNFVKNRCFQPWEVFMLFFSSQVQFPVPSFKRSSDLTDCCLCWRQRPLSTRLAAALHCLSSHFTLSGALTSWHAHERLSNRQTFWRTEIDGGTLGKGRMKTNDENMRKVGKNGQQIEGVRTEMWVFLVEDNDVFFRRRTSSPQGLYDREGCKVAVKREKMTGAIFLFFLCGLSGWGPSGHMWGKEGREKMQTKGKPLGSSKSGLGWTAESWRILRWKTGVQSIQCQRLRSETSVKSCGSCTEAGLTLLQN